MTGDSAYIFRQIRTAIITGEYGFNQRLPSERHLAEKYAVARGTVRAALERLEQARLVRRQFASGTFVSHPDQFNQSNIAEETSPLELIEARLAIESHIVGLAVTNTNNRDMRKLEQTLHQVIDCHDNPEHFSAADEAFHLMLAQCSQNPLLVWIYSRINAIRNHTQWSRRKYNILTPTKIQQYNRHHHALFVAIRNRDREQAVAQITAHLHQVRQDLLGYRQ